MKLVEVRFPNRNRKKTVSEVAVERIRLDTGELEQAAAWEAFPGYPQAILNGRSGVEGNQCLSWVRS